MKTFQCLFEVMNCWFSPYILLLLNDKFKIWPRVCKKHLSCLTFMAVE